MLLKMKTKVKAQYQEECDMVNSLQEVKARLQEERLRFELSKHNKQTNANLEQQQLMQSIEERHKTAERRYNQLCLRKKNDIKKTA